MIDTDSHGSNWRTVHRLRTHERVLAQVEEKILGGRLRVGDRLPTERELVDALEVSRTSVREALRVLESLGIIESHARSGADTGSIVTGRSTTALSNLLRLRMALRRFELADLVNVRIQLERAAAGKAAAEATPDELDHLRSLVDAMGDSELDHERFHELDSEFHVSIARASHNALGTTLMQALRDAVQNEMKAAFATISDWPSTARRLTEEHHGIFSAIERGAGELAARRTARHIADFYEPAGSGLPPG